jgi:hypothetical protein
LFSGSAGGDPVLTKAVFHMQSLAASLASLPLALTIDATSIGAALSKVFPGWYAILAGIAAVLMVSVVGCVARSGFFSPNGGYAFIGLRALAVWLVVTSIVLIMSAPTAPETRRSDPSRAAEPQIAGQ